MNDFDIPEHLFDRIYEIKYDKSATPVELVSYFPFADEDKKAIRVLLGSNILFRSIFSDVISEEEWQKTKEQIKKRFNDELLDIDGT
ncbi:MAG: hypothetical protein COW27_04435 [Nitrosopumilales archaeon CG15_BIG_FIL_POST_REV_8_21_14_020_37_12]|nr:MAG: hypothetical protein COW27_04435 [Nitrosopumilales archaeon CG15_BIG_FIL_POST_REV_8_21_14_020_37_12]